MRKKPFLLSLPVVLALPIVALCGCSSAPTSPSTAATTESAASPSPTGVSREMLLKWAALHNAWHQRMAASGAVALSPSGSLDPSPLPGGFAPGAHVFVPGPPEFGLQGLDVEPGTVTDFNGFSAVGYFAGTAVGSDGVTYDMLNDMRLQQGTYIAVDGSVRRGTFALT